MRRACGFLLPLGKVTPEVFLEARLLGAPKGIGEAHHAGVMMPAPPVTPLVMIQTEFFFQFAIIQLHPPARFGDAHEPPPAPRAAGPARPARI